MAKSITQEEADILIKMEKVKVDDNEWSLPVCSKKISVPLQSKTIRKSLF